MNLCRVKMNIISDAFVVLFVCLFVLLLLAVLCASSALCQQCTVPHSSASCRTAVLRAAQQCTVPASHLPVPRTGSGRSSHNNASHTFHRRHGNHGPVTIFQGRVPLIIYLHLLYIYIYIYITIYISLYMCIYIYIYMYRCMYVCIYVYMVI